MSFAGVLTGIGSLPHRSLDAALAYSFAHDLPFLPQLPQMSAQEWMISQALKDFPGAKFDEDGVVSLNCTSWREKSAASGSAKLKEVHEFHALAWEAFLWECETRKVPAAKLQFVGPYTLQSVLFGSTSRDSLQDLSHEEKGKLGKELLEHLILQATSAAQALQSRGIQPVLFWDEPALVALDFASVTEKPSHSLTLTEIRFAVRALQKQGVITGLHCCGNTLWKEVLDQLPLDLLSFDAGVSWDRLRLVLDERAGSGLRLPQLVAGVVSTSQPEQLNLSHDTIFSSPVLLNALYTASCGLGLQSIENSEAVLGTLQLLQKERTSFVARTVSDSQSTGN